MTKIKNMFKTSSVLLFTYSLSASASASVSPCERPAEEKVSPVIKSSVRQDLMHLQAQDYEDDQLWFDSDGHVLSAENSEGSFYDDKSLKPDNTKIIIPEEEQKYQEQDKQAEEIKPEEVNKTGEKAKMKKD